MVMPADYFSESPPPRVIGTEAECSIQTSGDNDPIAYIQYDATKKAGYKRAGRFLDNGMAVYKDVQHLEIDSAEALGPRQAAAADAAAMYALANIVEAAGLKHRGLYRYAGTIVGAQARTSGYHVSYLFPRQLAYSRFFRSIMASHMTTDLYTHNGTLSDKGFVLSQKAWDLGDPPITYQLERRTGLHEKPMATIPLVDEDEDVIGDSRWARFERRFSDPGFSLTAQYLGFAATSLVMRLIEHRRAVNMDDLARSSFHRFAPNAQRFARDLRFLTTAPTINGKEISALDYQEKLMLAARDLAGKIELPEDEVKAIPLWSRVIDEMRKSDLQAHEYGRLPALLDFAARHQYLSRLADEAKVHLNNANRHLLDANLKWDRILPEGGGMQYWKRMPSPFVSREEVTRLIKLPPETRAAIRAHLIREGFASQVDWATVTTHQGQHIFLDPGP